MSYQPLDAGVLDKRVTIQSRTDTDDAAGGAGATVAWAGVATVWAGIDPQGSGSELVKMQQLIPAVQHVVKIRYRSGVTAKHRLVFGSRAFPIHEVQNPMERNEQLVLYCSEEPL